MPELRFRLPFPSNRLPQWLLVGGILLGFSPSGEAPGLAAELEPQTVLLEFSAAWCAPCQRMAPVVEELRRAGYPVRQVDIEKEPALARRFRITAVPTFVMVVEGREVDRIVGPATLDQLKLLCRLAPQRPVISPDQPPATNPSAPGLASSPTAPERPPVAQTSSPQPTSPLPPFDTRCRWAGPTENDLVAATVRIRIDDPGGRSTGSGTIIDARGGEALIVTCGHLFRESQGKSPVYVDLFGPQPARDLPAQVIYYDDKLDIGFLSIRITQPVVVARVAPPGYPLAVGDPVYSVGCGEGRSPEVWSGRVTALSKYLGPDNIEASGAPVVGRSGGGLFSSEGFLIGICNAADPPLNEGIYLALSEIHRSLDRLNLAAVYRTGGPGSRPVAAPSQSEIALTTDSQPAPSQASESSIPQSVQATPDLVATRALADPQSPLQTGTVGLPASSPEALTLAAGFPLPVRVTSRVANGDQSGGGSSEHPVQGPRFGLVNDRPAGSSPEGSQSGFHSLEPAAEVLAAQTAPQMALSPEERAAWEEINRRRAAGYEIVCVVRPMDQPHAPSEVIVLRDMSPQFFALLQKEGVKTLVRGEGTQATAMIRNNASEPNSEATHEMASPLVPISARNFISAVPHISDVNRSSPPSPNALSPKPAGAASVALPAAVMALTPPRTQ